MPREGKFHRVMIPREIKIPTGTWYSERNGFLLGHDTQKEIDSYRELLPRERNIFIEK